MEEWIHRRLEAYATCWHGDCDSGVVFRDEPTHERYYHVDSSHQAKHNFEHHPGDSASTTRRVHEVGAGNSVLVESCFDDRWFLDRRSHPRFDRRAVTQPIARGVGF